ncbi:MAG: hypothetical protein ABSF22_11030 [Bryobacteraceae bacterium]
MRYLGVVILLTSSVCLGQTAQPPATAAQLKYFRFMLLNVGSIDHSPDAIAAYESSLVVQFGLSAQESAAIHSAGQSLNALLTQLRQSTQALVAGKTSLTSADAATLASINTQREQTIASLANQILNSVSATTAARLRAPGNIMGTGLTRN